MAGSKVDDNDHLLRLIRKGGNTISNKFKVGDRVRIVRRNPDNKTGYAPYYQDIGKTCTVVEINSTNKYCLYDLKDSYVGLFKDEELELVHDTNCLGDMLAQCPQSRGEEFKLNKGDSKMSIVSRIRNLTQTKEQKLRQKYNIVNECGDRTSEGTDVLLDILFEQNAGEIDAKLAEIDKEDKADKKSK